MRPRSAAAAALAALLLAGAAPRHTTPHARGSFKLTVPSGPLISGSRIAVGASGIAAPFSLAIVGPGNLEGHDFLAPQVDAATSTTLIAAARHAVAFSTLHIVPPPAPRRGLIAVASYDSGIALHDPKTFALLGYAPIGGAPGDVAFDAAGGIYAPATDGATLARIARDPWHPAQIAGVPLGNEVQIDARTGDAFVTNRDVDGSGALTRITAGGRVTMVKTGDTAEGLALDGRGLAYVGNVNDNSIAVVDTKTMRVVRRLKSVPRTFGIALDDERHRLFVVSNMSQSMPGEGGRVAVIDLRSGRIASQSARFAFPLGVAYDRAHGRVIVTDEGNDTLQILDATTLRRAHPPLRTCRTPWRPHIDGGRLYVPCARANRVDVFDLRTLHRVSGAPFATGGFPLGVAVWR